MINGNEIEAEIEKEITKIPQKWNQAKKWIQIHYI